MTAVARDGRLWHPFADMAHVAGNECVITEAAGAWLTDADGNRYLDATASLWYANIGHGRARMAQAIADQVRRLDAYMIFGDFANEPALELAERLADLAPIPDGRVFLTTGGGDSIETAAKIARRYWALRGEPRRVHLLGRSGAFHGAFGFGTSLGGLEPNRDGFGPLVGETSLVPHDSLAALERRIHELGPEHVAAFFCEPVIGAGGVIPPSPGYLEGVSALCDEHGILLVVDEVICAFGRLGTWFGIERWPEVRPDMIAFAKGVTSGYLPLGGIVVSGAVADPFWTGGGALRQGTTYAGHPTCCTAALTNLAILEEEGLVARGRELETELADALRPLADHPLVAEVRAGLGLLAAVELSADALGAHPGLTGVVQQAARREGVIVRPLLSSLAISPPLTITSEEIGRIASGVGAALDHVAASAGVG
jgi:putrescine aminotransferase